ncbi:hypothetical protein [Spirillospora sp. NPDC047279]|uniref:hypothetical protein n=1 Tax=Spirillospora sp. NPDC047279 TaxID=3155478 RepID=UPI0033DF0360
MTPPGPSTTPPAAVPGLLAGLVDDAGLFPPTSLHMADALRRHLADQAARHPMLSHRFLCPASRLAELRGPLSGGQRVRVGLIADTGVDGLADALAEIRVDPRLEIALLEVPLAAVPGDEKGAIAAVRAVTGGLAVPSFFEPASYDRVARTVQVLEGDEGLKLRCGGVRAGLFPSAPSLAGAIVTAVAASVAFKATAGLHEAIRHHDPHTGFTHHGYLNLLLATGEAAAGAEPYDVRTALELTDPGAVIARLRRLDGPRVRRSLVSYGSCSTATPIEQARELGLEEG